MHHLQCAVQLTERYVPFPGHTNFLPLLSALLPLILRTAFTRLISFDFECVLLCPNPTPNLPE